MMEREAVVSGGAAWIAFMLWRSKIGRDVRLFDLTNEEISDLLGMVNLAERIEKELDQNQ